MEQPQCSKANVITLLKTTTGEYVFGQNHVIGIDYCNETFCKEDYSLNPTHRHNKCKAIHSVIDALSWVPEFENIEYAHIGRYPCKECYIALANRGCKEIYYSGEYELPADLIEEMRIGLENKPELIYIGGLDYVRVRHTRSNSIL